MPVKKTKLGPSYKFGEPTLAVTVRIPVSVYSKIPEPKRQSIVTDLITKYKDASNEHRKT